LVIVSCAGKCWEASYCWRTWFEYFPRLFLTPRDVSCNFYVPKRIYFVRSLSETYLICSEFVRNVSTLLGVCPTFTCSSSATFRRLALLPSSGAGNELCWTPFESDDGSRVGFRDGRFAIILLRWHKIRKADYVTLCSLTLWRLTTLIGVYRTANL
jgi:hypothetical protein